MKEVLKAWLVDHSVNNPPIIEGYNQLELNPCSPQGIA